METLTLNDGTVLAGHCIRSGRNLYIYLDNMSILNGVALFSDASKVGKIIENNHGTENVYQGFTRLVAVSHEFGNCNIVMEEA